LQRPGFKPQQPAKVELQTDRKNQQRNTKLRDGPDPLRIGVPPGTFGPTTIPAIR